MSKITLDLRVTFVLVYLLGVSFGFSVGYGVTFDWGWTRGPCSATCGSGYRTEIRPCPDEMTCTDDDTIRVVECYMGDCLVFSGDVIGECSVTCGDGVRIDVINGVKRKVPCQNQACEVYGEWKARDCSATCGFGTRVFFRDCIQGSCEDDLIKIQPCKIEDCPTYSVEDVKGECSVSCGGGMRIDVINGVNRIIPCQTQVCEVYGDWELGPCSASCGFGIRVDFRECVQGLCKDDLYRTKSCKVEDCLNISVWDIKNNN